MTNNSKVQLFTDTTFSFSRNREQVITSFHGTLIFAGGTFEVQTLQQEKFKLHIVFKSSKNQISFGVFSWKEVQEIIADLQNKSTTQYFPLCFDRLLSPHQIDRFLILLLLSCQVGENF